MFICYLHNYKTQNPYKWDKHCYETKHKLEIWKNNKKTIKRYPKNWFIKQHDPISLLNLMIAQYIQDKEFVD